MNDTMQDFVLIPPHDDIELWEAYHKANLHEERYGRTPVLALMRAFLANQEQTA